MKSIKPGRGPSMMGGIICIAVALFGVLWTIGASSITGGFGSTSFGNDFMIAESAVMGSEMVQDQFSNLGGFGFGPFDVMDAIFPLFGVVFVTIAIIAAVYNFKNATSKDRYSEYDIVDGNEESDPLNDRFGRTGYEAGSSDPFEGSTLFCPYCGTPADDDYRFCKKCGKQLPKK